MSKTQMSPQEYYRRHGQMTDPGAFTARLSELPQDIHELCQIVQGLIIHYRTGELYGVEIPAHRLDEARTRRIETILGRMQELDDRPLAHARSPERRFVGCCRDFATLLCAILRTHGIPARVRTGFSTYFDPTFACDHWVTEYWNDEEQRWVVVDAEMDEPKRSRNRVTFDPCDVPRDRFRRAGEVWQACRAGVADAAAFGYDPDAHGIWVIRNNLLHDVACLNKVELTPWDFWGLGVQDVDALSDEDRRVLDTGASLSLGGDAAFEALRAFYAANDRTRVPPIVVSYTLTDERTEARVLEALE